LLQGILRFPLSNTPVTLNEQQCRMPQPRAQCKMPQTRAHVQNAKDPCTVQIATDPCYSAKCHSSVHSAKRHSPMQQCRMPQPRATVQNATALCTVQNASAPCTRAHTPRNNKPSSGSSTRFRLRQALPFFPERVKVRRHTLVHTTRNLAGGGVLTLQPQ